MSRTIDRRRMLRLAAAGATAPLAISAPFVVRAAAKEKVTYAYLLDPVYDAVLWAIRKGKVTSDLIDVEATGANIPTLLQATSTKQFDVVMTAVIGVPAALARGLELRILSAALYQSAVGEGGGVWVKKGSDIKEPPQLKGKTLASYGLRSTGYMYVREALRKEFGLNMVLEGGDMRQVEVVAPNLPAALATGQADAAVLIHSQAYRAQVSGDFVNICETGVIMNKHYGRTVSAVNVGYPERLAAKPEAYKEFCRMMKASCEYALKNRDEVFPDLAKQANIDRAFFDWWFDKTTDVPGTFTADHAGAVTKGWEIGKNFGMIQAVPDVAKLTWEHAIKA